MSSSENPDITNSPFEDVPIEISVSIGKARPKIKDMLGLSQDDLLTLDKTMDDPVELYVGEKLIARGTLEQDNDQGKLAVRLVEIVSTRSGG